MHFYRSIAAFGLLSSVFLCTASFGEPWRRLGPPIDGFTSHAAMLQLPTEPERILIASRGNTSVAGGEHRGLWTSDDGGQTWQFADQSVGQTINNNRGMVAGNQSGEVWLVQETSPNLCHSLDGGRTWDKTDAPFKHGICIVTDPGNKDRLWVGADDGLWRSDDLGQTWQSVTGGLPPDARGVSNTLTAIAIDPTDANRMYAGFLYAAMDHPWGVYRSSDGGQTWQTANEGLPEGELILDFATATNQKVKMALPKYGLQYRAIKDLILDPAHPQTLYAITRQNGMYRTDDGATTWQPVELPQGDSIHSNYLTGLSVDADGNRLIVGTGGLNVAVSTDCGDTWQMTGPLVPIQMDENKVVTVELPWGAQKTGKPDQTVSQILGGPYYSSVHRVHVDVTDPRILYAETDAGIYVQTRRDSP